MEFFPLVKGVHLEGLALDDDTLWYSDVMAGGVHRRAADGRDRSWREGDLCIGGLLVNGDGKILSTGIGGIRWFDPLSGSSGTVIDSLHGQPLPGVNEMAVYRDGGIAFGTIDIPAFLEGRPTAPSALWRLAAEGELMKLCDGLRFSNGLAFSADFRWLYHNESFAGVHAYELDDRGQVVDDRLLLDKPDCDGIKVDASGRIWVCGFSSSEILILRPDGAIDGAVPLPGEASTNLLFGGPDGRDLYVTTVAAYGVSDPGDIELFEERESTLYRGRSPIAGLPVSRPGLRLV